MATVTLNGTRLSLEYSLRDLREAERLIDRPLLTLVVRERSFTLDQLGILLWKGIRPRVKAQEIERLIDAHIEGGGGIGELQVSVIEAIAASGILGKREGEGDSGPLPVATIAPSSPSAN